MGHSVHESSSLRVGVGSAWFEDRSERWPSFRARSPGERGLAHWSSHPGSAIHRDSVPDCKTLYHKRKAGALEGRKLPENLRIRPIFFKEIAQDALAWSDQHTAK
jgi:hypothetical protein